MQTIDLDSYEPRVPTRKENYDAVTVLDSLPNLDLLGPYTPYFGFEGIPQAMSIPESIASRLRNSTKALVGGSLNGSEVFTIQMAQALGTEILHAISASPPLTWYHQPIEALYRIVAAGFPMRIVGGQMFGGTAPATLSGALVTNNAEIILAVVVAQLLKPGTRIIVDDFVSPLNMKTGSPAFSDIGISLHHAAFNQVWRSYGLPMCNLSCGYINSKRIDYQTGYEKAISVVLSAVSGTSYIGMHGSVSAELTFHPLQAILDDDVAGMIGRFLEGLQVNDETLALDLINQVGPVPGMYLDKEHTRKWWSKEQYVPVAADRLTYTTWKESGKKSCLDYAGDRMEEILATHRCTPLSPGQEEDIKRILEDATLYFKEKGLISAEEMTAYRKALKGATD